MTVEQYTVTDAGGNMTSCSFMVTVNDTEDPVETIGIQRTHAYIDGADLILFMVDVSCPFSGTDHQIYETIKNKPAILVLNKSDLVADDFKADLPYEWHQLPRQNISAVLPLFILLSFRQPLLLLIMAAVCMKKRSLPPWSAPRS